jgi:glycerophosphoryl diester phosphodiesterase
VDSSTELILPLCWPITERPRPDGLSVTTGTVNDAPGAARAAVLGVDGITTDRPAALHRELAATSLAA